MTMYGADGLEFVRKLSQIAVSNLDLIDMEISEPRPMRERVPIFEIVNQWPHLPEDREATITLTFKVTIGDRRSLRPLPVAILDLLHAADRSLAK